MSRGVAGAVVLLLSLALASVSQEASNHPPDKVPSAHEGCGVQFMHPRGWDTIHRDSSLREGACRILIRRHEYLWKDKDDYPDIGLHTVTVTVLETSFQEAAERAHFERRNGNWQIAGDASVAVDEVQRTGWTGLRGTTTIPCPESQRALPPTCPEFRAILSDRSNRSAIVVGGANTRDAFETILQSLTFLVEETYENARCEFKFNYSSNWLVVERDSPGQDKGRCRVTVQPKSLEALLAECDVDSYTIDIVVFDGDLAFAAADRHFEQQEAGWQVLGRHDIRGDAKVIESNRWIGVEGSRTVGCYHEVGGYAGLCEMASVVLNNRGNHSASIDALPQGYYVYKIILDSFEFTAKIPKDVP